MADFAPNVTARYKLHYNVAGRIHTMMCRAARGTSFAPGATQCAVYLRGLFQAMAGLLADDLSFISAEFALTDVDIFVPAPLPAGVVGLVSAATFSPQDTITHATFSGRTLGGSKGNVKLYGVQFSPDTTTSGTVENDFVINASELTSVANAITSLNTGSGIIVGIDNQALIYHQRATLKINDFWLKRVRQGL